MIKATDIDRAREGAEMLLSAGGVVSKLLSEMVRAWQGCPCSNFSGAGLVVRSYQAEPSSSNSADSLSPGS